MNGNSKVTFYLPNTTVEKINKISTISDYSRKSHIIIKAIDTLHDKIFKVTKEDKNTLDSIRKILSDSLKDDLYKIKEIIQ